MVNAAQAVVFAMFALTLVSCGARTKVGGTSTSPDSKFEASVVCLGASGRAYVEETPKECALLVARSGSKTFLFRQAHTFVGSDINWQFSWPSASELVIRIFDRGASGIGSNERSIYVAHLRIEENGNVSELPNAT